jgi:hypothetical protein
MFKHTLRGWTGRHLWILLFLSLVVLFCIYRITLRSPVFINIGAEDDEPYVHNFHLREQGEHYPFRWTRDSSYIKIPNLASLPVEITLGADAARPEGESLPRVSLIANGTVLADFTMQNGIWAHQFLYHPSLSPLPRDLLLEVKSDTFVPPDSDESRALGILLNSVEVKPISSPFHLLQVSLMPSLLGALSIALSYLLLHWLGASQRASLVCGIIALALLGLGIVQQFIVVRFLIWIFGLLLVAYVLTTLLEVRGYRGGLSHLSKLFAKPAPKAQSDPVASLKENQISDVLPAYLPAVVLFVLMPFALFLPNQGVFNNNLTLVLPYLVLAVMYLVFGVVLFFIGPPWRTRVAIVLFYVGLYLSLSDVIAPVQLGELVGGRETPTEPLFLTAVEVVLAAIVIYGAVKLPWKHVKSFGSIFVLLLLVSEAIVVLSGLSPDTELPFIKSGKNTLSNPSGKLADRGNIYHITLDAYSSLLFLESLEKMKLTEEFDGFTFFKNNRANYDYTTVSIPSYMTGSFYEENDSLKEWQEQHRSLGIVSNIYNAGYEVSMYTQDSTLIHEKVSHVKLPEDMLSQRRSLSSFHHFSDLWLLRVVPNFLQQEVYWEGKGVFTRLFVQEEVLAGKNANVFGSVELMRQLIDDEADRPDHGQYIYAYLWLPHRPYVMNRDCVFSPDSDYNEQALCATRLIAELVSALKELGRYDESTIILQSDHAVTWNPGLEGASERTMSLEIEKGIEAINLSMHHAEEIDNITRALLLIKPPLQSTKSLVISNRLTQLADIPATIYDLLDLPARAKEGISAFSPGFPETREAHVFLGLYTQRDEKGEKRKFGKDLFEGEANHFSFTNGKGWKIYPNIHVRWE